MPAGQASLMMVLQLACPLLKIIYQNSTFLQPDASEITRATESPFQTSFTCTARCRRLPAVPERPSFLQNLGRSGAAQAAARRRRGAGAGA